MAILNQDVWALHCAKILIEQYAYSIIDVRTNAKEIWLGNPNREDYPLLRLTGENFFRRPFDTQRVQRIRQAIETFFKREMNLTEVEFFTDAPLEEEGQVVKLSPELCTDPHFCEAFPEVKEVLRFADDPQNEYNKLSEAIRAVRDKQVKEARKQFAKGIPWASFIIIGICTAISVTINLLAANYDIIASSIFLGAYYKTFVLAGYEYWRFFTTGFVHIDLFHLLINMMALTNIGMMLERLYGRKKYLSILFSGIIVGSLFVFIGQNNIVSVGISGGLYALLGSLIVYAYDNGWLKQPAFRSQLVFILSINLLVNLIPNVSVLGHAGGFVSGLLLGIIYSETPHLALLRKNAKIAALALLVLLVPISQVSIKHGPFYAKTDQYVIDLALDFGFDSYAEHMADRLSDYYEEVAR